VGFIFEPVFPLTKENLNNPESVMKICKSNLKLFFQNIREVSRRPALNIKLLDAWY